MVGQFIFLPKQQNIMASSIIFRFLNILVMLLLIIVISLQNKSSGLSNVFGGGGNIVQTRRGFEKWLFYATIVLGIIFMAINISFLFFSK
jgi:protein translocase SecG subunit